MLRRGLGPDIRSWLARSGYLRRTDGSSSLPDLMVGGVGASAERLQAAPARSWLTWTSLWPRRTPSREGYGLAAVALVGFGSSLVSGYYNLLALLAIVAGLAVAALALTGSSNRAHQWAWCLAALLGAVSTGILLHGPTLLSWFGPIAGGLGAVVAISVQRRLWRACGAVVAGTPGLVGLTKSLVWGHVHIDVFDFTQRATGQLLRGQDPYRFRYPTTTAHLPLAHYFYLPGVLLLSIPGRLIGDVRVSDLLAAMAIVATVTVLARRTGGVEQAWRCLALCLTLPFFPLMIQFDWAEIYLLLAIALWVLFRDRHRLSAVLILGVGVATVPTALPLLVLPFLWWRRPRREILVAFLVAVVICLPFVVWAGPGKFVYSTLLVNIHLPPWPTGLDLDAAFHQATGTWLPAWLWPAVVVFTLLVVARVRGRSWPNAFYLGSTLLLVTFVWAKWASFNYYFLAAVGLILAMALEPSAGPATPPSSSARPEGAIPEGWADPPAAEPGQTAPALT
jgi:hypothetical protein